MEAGVLKNGNGTRTVRAVFDSSIALALLGLAFWTGTMSQKVEGMQQPGGVPISTEARERLAVLESRWNELSARLTRIEEKLDRLNGTHQ